MRIGQRSTRPRQLVVEALSSFDDFRSAQDIQEALRARGESVSRATVFRTLRVLATTPDVDVIVRSDGETVYRRCSPIHHHHLVCRYCGCTLEVVGRAIERWSTTTATREGFDEVTHTLEVFGRCSECRAMHEATGQRPEPAHGG